MKIGGENFLFERLFLFYRKNDEKCRQNKFPSYSQSKVTYWPARRGWSKASLFDIIFLSEWSKICAKHLCSRFLSKSFCIRPKSKSMWKKITFMKKEKIKLEKLLNKSWFIDFKNSWVAPVERESIFAYIRYFTKKYFKRNLFKFRAKDQKCTFLYTRESSELYPRGNQWVKKIQNYFPTFSSVSFFFQKNFNLLQCLTN